MSRRGPHALGSGAVPGLTPRVLLHRDAYPKETSADCHSWPMELGSVRTKYLVAESEQPHGSPSEERPRVCPGIPVRRARRYLSAPAGKALCLLDVTTLVRGDSGVRAQRSGTRR